MKTLIRDPRKTLAWASFTAVFMLAGAAVAQPTPRATPPTKSGYMYVTSDGSGEADSASIAGASSSSGEADSSGGSGAGSSWNNIRIESIEPARADEMTREVTWLGLSTEEASQALASQLGLKPGQGLVVVFVSPNSPAARAGIQKYDVLEEFDHQMLVDPAQLRKLVQMQKDGDTIKLSLYRGAKKQEVSATLAKRSDGLGMWSAPESEGENMATWTAMARSAEDMKKQMIDKKELNAEVQRSMEEARKEIQEALRQSAQANRGMRPMATPVPPVAPTPPVPPIGDLGSDATVTVTKDGDSVKTIVRSDDSGEIVIVANPKKRLTAHDEDGKLLFDGEIETPEQQAKVPPALWKKVKLLLKQISPAGDREPQPHAELRAPKI